MRTLVRKRFSNWKLKTFCHSSSINNTKQADNQIHKTNKIENFITRSGSKSELRRKVESEFIDYNRNDKDYIQQSDSVFKNYNHPFTPVAQSNNKKTTQNNNNFSREDLNREFENKQNQFNNENGYNENLIRNENKNITYSDTKNNDNRSAKNENSDENVNKYYSSVKENRPNSRNKYDANNAEAIHLSNKINANGHPNTTRNRDTSASKKNRNVNSHSNNQYSSLFSMNSNRNASNEKIKSPQKIYEKLHQVNPNLINTSIIKFFKVHF